MSRDEKRLRLESAREWLDYARNDLSLARLGEEKRTELAHQICFLTQQAAEKAIKAVFISRGISFPFVHDIGVLLEIAVKENVILPEKVAASEELTPYAVEARYPGMNGPITQEEVLRAVVIGEAVIKWAEGLIGEEEESD